MTVSELIEALTGLDGDKEVKFAYNYGDHWRTQVAADIDNVEEGYVTHSEYHRMDKVVESDDDDSDEEYNAKIAAAKTVVILS